MEAFPDASGPPYPYGYPLPSAAAEAHLRATRHWQKKINKWNGFVLFPGILFAVVSLFWGRGRSAGPNSRSIWQDSATLGWILLIGGLVLIALATFKITSLAVEKGRHTRLLKAYQIPLDPTGTDRVAGPERQPEEMVESARELLDRPLPGKVEPVAQPAPPMPEVDDPYDGVMRLEPPKRP